MKKKVVILTLNDYIIYQPTILNLYDFLSPHFDVTVVSFQPQYVTKQKDETRNIIYLETDYWATQFYQKTDFILSKVVGVARKFLPKLNYHYLYYNHYLPNLLKTSLKKLELGADIVIAVDLAALHVAQELYGSVHFLSLEIDNQSNSYYKKIDHNKIKSVFIQSQMRSDYLFPHARLRTFIVQNAPVFDSKRTDVEGRKDFIWAGTIDRRFGVLDCIRFFDRYAQYRLVLKGGRDRKTMMMIERDYHHLVQSGRIHINQDYLPADAFIDFISGFRIGFCFYAWDMIHASFNYQTAPSGKMFMYFAAGVPVIACNIPGFSFVKDFGAGVLIDDYEPATIYRAIQEIEANYKQYADACYRAAEYFSFDRNVEPYIQFLLKEG